MKLFIDTAITEEIVAAAELGIISGVTTNPSLLARSGKTLNEVITEILKLVNGPVSAEVEESTAENMYAQAHEIVNSVDVNPNITIKLPVTEDGIKVCRKLSKEGIMTNVTLVFSVSQALLAMEAGATFISPFMGRIDDRYANAESGFKLLEKIAKVKANYGYYRHHTFQGDKADVLPRTYQSRIGNFFERFRKERQIKPAAITAGFATAHKKFLGNKNGKKRCSGCHVGCGML